eukprot:1151273-Pelagomonas_calceolata.AAC.4
MGKRFPWDEPDKAAGPRLETTCRDTMPGMESCGALLRLSGRLHTISGRTCFRNPQLHVLVQYKFSYSCARRPSAPLFLVKLDALIILPHADFLVG